jgi:choline kinase
MKIVILAAGKGSRLGDNDLPKPLTPLLDGKSILQHQIENLELYFSRQDIMIVVGYHKELIMNAFDDLLFIYSPRYAQENTSKSLLRAVKKIKEDLLWINGDVVFHPGVLEKLIALKNNAMVVTTGSVGEEEVKYSTNSAGKITAVSKTITNGEGEAVGINFLLASALPLFQKHLEECNDQDYFEKALENCIGDGLELKACPISTNLCTEIDFPSDLERANSYLSNW